MPKSQTLFKGWNYMLRREKAHGQTGQGMVEFALTIPILLLVLWAVIEFGWMLFVYSSVSSASREAARYGAAVDNFSDCAGIRDAAKRVGLAAGIDDANITIVYDHLKSGASHTGCESLATGDIVPGSRIQVDVATIYSPLVPLPLPDLNLQSSNAHTIVTDLHLTNGGGGGGGGNAAEYVYIAGMVGTNQTVEGEPITIRQGIVQALVMDSTSHPVGNVTVTGDFSGQNGFSYSEQVLHDDCNRVVHNRLPMTMSITPNSQSPLRSRMCPPPMVYLTMRPKTCKRP